MEAGPNKQVHRILLRLHSAVSCCIQAGEGYKQINMQKDKKQPNSPVFLIEDSLHVVEN